MSDLVIPFYAIQLSIFVVLALILVIAWNRIKVIIIDPWRYEIQFTGLSKRPILMTIVRMYANMQGNPPDSLAEDIANELTTNLALAYDEPTYFFLKVRANPDKMRKYIRDEELIEFFYRPQLWVNRVYPKDISFWSMFRKPTTKDDFLPHLERIVGKFENEILKATNPEKLGEKYSSKSMLLEDQV